VNFSQLQTYLFTTEYIADRGIVFMTQQNASYTRPCIKFNMCLTWLKLLHTARDTLSPSLLSCYWSGTASIND